MIETVKAIVSVVDGTATVDITEVPNGIAVNVEIRDYDIVPGCDESYLDEDSAGDKYLSVGAFHPATGERSSVTALAAIMARIQGEFDHPALAAYGPLEADTLADVLRIAQHAFDASAPSLNVYQLSELLGRLPVARCVMQPADVLSAFNLSMIEETGDTEEQRAERLSKAADWLRDNRKYVEEAMTTAGFNAIEDLASTADFNIASDAGPWGIWWSEAESWKTNDDAVIYEFTSKLDAESFIRHDLHKDSLAGCSFQPRRLDAENE
jgi:hypothetical protein